MEPRIELLKSKKLIGIHKEMSLSNNKTGELWQEFMPRRSEVINRINADFISMQKYPINWDFSPDMRFIKWATVEVSSFGEVPPKIETYLLQGGKYAVFIHDGPASAAAKTMQYIFSQWLPKSEYALDNREHFEILPEGYNPVDPNAEEEIWVPIKG
jgi:AraC family transcriptional regulator